MKQIWSHDLGDLLLCLKCKILFFFLPLPLSPLQAGVTAQGFVSLPWASFVEGGAAFQPPLPGLVPGWEQGLQPPGGWLAHQCRGPLPSHPPWLAPTANRFREQRQPIAAGTRAGCPQWLYPAQSRSRCSCLQGTWTELGCAGCGSHTRIWGLWVVGQNQVWKRKGTVPRGRTEV